MRLQSDRHHLQPGADQNFRGSPRGGAQGWSRRDRPLARLVIGGPLVNALALSGAVDEAVAIHSTIRQFADEQPMTTATVAFDMATLRITLLRGDVDGPRRSLARPPAARPSGAHVLPIEHAPEHGRAGAQSRPSRRLQADPRGARNHLGPAPRRSRRAPLPSGIRRVHRFDVSPRRQAISACCSTLFGSSGYPFALGLALTLAARVALSAEIASRLWPCSKKNRAFPTTPGHSRLRTSGRRRVCAGRGRRCARAKVARARLLAVASRRCVVARRASFRIEGRRSLCGGASPRCRGRACPFDDRVRDLRPTVSHHDLERWPWSVRIRLLGATCVEPDPAPMLGDRQMPLRLLELLAVLGARQPSSR